jgi:hypothetical protein
MVLETILLTVGIASVVSTETTGKGLADHAISTGANQDCKIARIVHGESVCQPNATVTVTVSAPSAPVVMRSTAVSDAERVFAQRRAAK